MSILNCHHTHIEVVLHYMKKGLKQTTLEEIESLGDFGIKITFLNDVYNNSYS